MATVAITLAAPNKTGASRMVKYFSDSLCSAGHQVRIIHGPPARDEHGNDISILSEFDCDKVSTTLVSSLARPIPPWIYSKMLAATKGCDVVVGVNQRDRSVALNVAARLNVPGVLAVQNQHTFWGPAFIPALKRRYYGKSVRKLAHVLICTSSVVQEELVNGFHVNRSRCPVLTNGVEVPNLSPIGTEEKQRLRKELGIPPETRVFANVGRLDVQKGQDILLRAWSKAGLPRGSAHLLLIGDISGGSQESNSRRYRQDLVQSVQNLNITDSVTLLGWRDNVSDILLQSDIYVHSARWEGFSLAVLEAMAMYLPVIMTDCSGRPNGFREEHGIIVHSESECELADAISSMAAKEMPELSQMGASCRRLCEKEFDIRLIAKRFVQIIEAALVDRHQDFEVFSKSRV